MTEQTQQFDSAELVKHLTHQPGVYQMLDAEGKQLYIGKAADLKKRVSSYFTRSAQIHRIRAMLNQVCRVEVTVTSSEAEALLLENNLIKQFRPRYNVLLRDDKSYPYIYVSLGEAFPRLSFHRGGRSARGKFFGPYPSAGAVRETLSLLQKLFRLRQCDDSFFRNRSRPCLQYQINRCTAPCVGLIDESAYQSDIDLAVRFLEGKKDDVTRALQQRMDTAASRLEYELAAHYRDQIESLRRVSEQQYVSGERGDLDIIACSMAQGFACVQVFNIRSGLSLGNRAYFPRIPGEMKAGRLLTAFLGQYYLTHPVPENILLSDRPDDAGTLESMLSSRLGRKVTIDYKVRGSRARWLANAKDNADYAMKVRLASRAGVQKRLEALQDELQLDDTPNRMECFDISHTMGESTVASCVVFNQEGPVKSDYRRFNIESIEPGDDYAAMRQALTRRYTRLKKGEGKLPDILFIDGGKGQVRQAIEVLEELQIEGVTIIGVAKGAGRKPGLETLISSSYEPRSLQSNSLALHLIQQIRDEAHRFAITGHRQKRAKSRRESPLEKIPGLGPKRRQSLLKYFGGWRGVSRAGEQELAKVPGISPRLAGVIYDVLHPVND